MAGCGSGAGADGSSGDAGALGDAAAPTDTASASGADGADGGSAAPEAVCGVEQPPPYLDSPYPGLHGNAGNNERIPCAGPELAPVAGWTALEGSMIFNPATIGRDHVYAVVARSGAAACRLWSIGLGDGEQRCVPQDPSVLSFGVLGSGPELDTEGNIYVADGWEDQPDGLLSFTSEGRLRWHRTFEGLRTRDSYQPPLGLHLTPQGYAATVTPDGLVVLVSMAEEVDGDGIAAHLDIPRELGLAPLPPAPMPEIESLPTYLECRIENVLGDDLPPEELLPALAGGTGGTGAYTDNSIAVAGDLLFVVGGGPPAADGYAERGALVVLKIAETADGPELRLHWRMEINGASGSSPTVDPTGRFVVVTDVTDEGRARLVVADLAACEAIVGEDPPLCTPAWTWELDGGALLASVSMDEFGVVYAWNQGTEEHDAGGIPDAELLAVEGPRSACPVAGLPWDCELHAEPRLLWSRDLSLPERPGTTTEWTSTVLVLDDLVVGTVMHWTAHSVEQLGLPFPIPTMAEHEVVGVRRADGEVRWRVPFPNAAVNSPMLGPDGNLYVPIFGVFDFLKVPSGLPPASCEDFVEEDYQGGVIQFLARD